VIELPVVRLREEATLPERAYAGDAGLDLSTCERVELAPGERAVVPTGLAVAIPARAGMVNVGGEGQIVVGAVAAAGVGLALDQETSGAVVIVLMLIASAVAGTSLAGSE